MRDEPLLLEVSDAVEPEPVEAAVPVVLEPVPLDAG
jgi:hypothetical protein